MNEESYYPDFLDHKNPEEEKTYYPDFLDHKSLENEKPYFPDFRSQVIPEPEKPEAYIPNFQNYSGERSTSSETEYNTVGFAPAYWQNGQGFPNGSYLPTVPNEYGIFNQGITQGQLLFNDCSKIIRKAYEAEVDVYKQKALHQDSLRFTEEKEIAKERGKILANSMRYRILSNEEGNLVLEVKDNNGIWHSREEDIGICGFKAVCYSSPGQVTRVYKLTWRGGGCKVVVDDPNDSSVSVKDLGALDVLLKGLNHKVDKIKSLIWRYVIERAEKVTLPPRFGWWKDDAGNWIYTKRGQESHSLKEELV